MRSSTLLPVLLLASSILASNAKHHHQTILQNDDDGQKPIKGPLIKDIPPIGLGLWNAESDDATDSVTTALEAGYIHLDSAAAYSNEKYVGAALHSSGIPRSKYWITSKLWNDHHAPHLVKSALEKTLSDLGTPYLDLYLMHWPVAFEEGSSRLDTDTSILDTWHAMEELVRANLTRYIGISNFAPKDIEHLLEHANIRPYAHEYETHPYLQQSLFTAWHASMGIKVIAYSPLANVNPTYDKKYPDVPSILEDKFWVDMGERKNCTPAQAILAWGMARLTSVIPKSVHEKYILENLKSAKVEFSVAELAEVATEDKKFRFNDPSKGWGVDLFEGLDDGS